MRTGTLYLLSQRYAEEQGTHRENKRQPKRTKQSFKTELTHISTKCYTFHLMFVNTQEIDELKGLKGFKKVKTYIK